MTQSRRWAAWLAAFLLAASLVALPREGAAWTPYIDLTNPPVVDEGEPDVPGSTISLTHSTYEPIISRLMILRVGNWPVLLLRAEARKETVSLTRERRTR